MQWEYELRKTENLSAAREMGDEQAPVMDLVSLFQPSVSIAR